MKICMVAEREERRYIEPIYWTQGVVASRGVTQSGLDQ